MLQRLGCLQVLCFIKYNQPMMFFNPTCLRGGVRSQNPVLQGEPTWCICVFLWLKQCKLRRLLNYCLLVFLFSIVSECLIYCLEFMKSTSWKHSIVILFVIYWVLTILIPCCGYRVWKTQTLCVVISFFSPFTRLELNNSTTFQFSIEPNCYLH